jgi:hypothetical protein
MTSSEQAIDEFRRQPRSRTVWRLITEQIVTGPRTMLLTIDPETARNWLSCRASPAEPDPTRARRYAEIIRHGAWQPRKDEPIALRVDDERVMVEDGQHRLAAVVIHGATVELLVRMRMVP